MTNEVPVFSTIVFDAQISKWFFVLKLFGPEDHRKLGGFLSPCWQWSRWTHWSTSGPGTSSTKAFKATVRHSPRFFFPSKIPFVHNWLFSKFLFLDRLLFTSETWDETIECLESFGQIICFNPLKQYGTFLGPFLMQIRSKFPSSAGWVELNLSTANYYWPCLARSDA